MRPPSKPASRSKTVCEIFLIADREGKSHSDLCYEANVAPQNISTYRRGIVEPGITKVEGMAAALGYRLALVPIDDSDTKP